ncbi:Uncharacterized mitochondrial protein AtMg00310, partial [Linum perenne]
LGFKCFSDFNLSLLAKQGWRILNNNDALWVRLLKSIYFPKGEFLTAKRSSRPSCIWSSFFKVRDLVSFGATKRVGDRTSINVNFDPCVLYLSKFMTPFNGCSAHHVYDLILPEPRRWDHEIINQFFSPSHAKTITMISIGPKGITDDWKWSFSRNGDFSVRSTYHATRTSSYSSEVSTVYQGNDKSWKW